MDIEYQFNRTDAGRSLSKRAKQKNDCTVRAVALVKQLPYDEAYDLLKTAGRTSSAGFDLTSWLKEQPWASKISFPAVKGQSRMNPVTFVQQFPKGTYICFVAKHVFACIDGVIHDTSPARNNRCIYTAWKIE